MRMAAFLVAVMAAPAVLTTQGLGVSAGALRQTFVDYWEWRLADEPELATQIGRSDYDDRWRDWSSAGRARTRTMRQEFLQRVLYIASGNLSPAERLSADLLAYDLRTELEAEPYLALVQRVSQQNGAHNQVFRVIDQMPARTVRDYENIIARLRALPEYVDQHIDLMREQFDGGLTQPAVIVDRIVEQVAAQRGTPAAESPLLAAFSRFSDDIPPADRERLHRQASAAYLERFVPAWTRYEAFLRDIYRPKARPQVGLTSLADGRRAYDVLVRTYTTTRMTPEDIHELGLREVARIEREMQRVAGEAGFDGPISEFERQLAARPDMRFSSQEEMLAYARDVLARVEPQMPRLFVRLPRAAVAVRPIPSDREAASASSYTAGTPDGARPAWFNMNTYRPQEQVKYRTEALVLHETLPGHHLQVGLARELTGVPEFRRALGITAFIEGWALYAESLGGDIGTVYREPATRFGQLASEQFRAVRLVVDTGMHALGWSRERALEYFTERVPSQSVAEIDRYIAWPGQALAYKVGELRIRELRRRAERELRIWFDIRDFHDAILRHGPMPLDMLDEQIDAYIASARASSPN
jgi:uncharacterized protein (DUF885 family)